MKQIINGKKYDTNTAELLLTTDNGLSHSDFNWSEEELYKKRTGEFFIRGTGGAATAYGRSCGQTARCGGSRIIPLSLEKAKEFGEKNMDADTYESVFGPVEE